ncbi:MAG: BON domain-containing protein [Burkholderiales bacterium]
MTHFKRTVQAVLLISLATLALSACAPLLLGGTATGVLVANDRRTSGAQLEDQTIEIKSLGNIKNVVGDRGHINVTSFNRRVLVTGEVPSAGDKSAVAGALSKTDNVQLVVNELVIGGTAAFANRARDTLVTTRVKASMIEARDLQASIVKVVTERGSVYLMGIVTQREADRASEVASSTSGVQRVVRLFEIVTEEELKRLLPPPPPPAPAVKTQPVMTNVVTEIK